MRKRSANRDDLLSTLGFIPSSTLEALKTLMKSIGYEEQVTYIQQFGGWDLLSSPEGHYEGVVLLAR